MEGIDDQTLFERFHILNTLYLPDLDLSKHPEINDTLTPVNVLRLTLRLYLDQDYPPIPDECYTHDNTLYGFKKVDPSRFAKALAEKEKVAARDSP